MQYFNTQKKRKPSSLQKLQAHRAERLAISTVKGDRCLIKHLNDYHGGNAALSTIISEEFLYGFAHYLLERVKPNSARTYFQKLYAIIRTGLRNQNLYVALPRISDLIPTNETEDRTALTAEELQRLLSSYCPHDSTKRAFLFGCFTGLRRSDIRTLEYGHIIESEHGYYINKQQVKTHSTVKVPLGDYAQAMLPNQTDLPPQKSYESSKRNTVFTLMSNSTIRNDLRIWAEHAGIDKPLTFHCARHTFASLLLNSKTELYVISKLCGHRHIKTTENYLHLFDNQRRNAIIQMEQQLSAINLNVRMW